MNREREKGFEPERTESTQWTESGEDHGPREARERSLCSVSCAVNGVRTAL